MTPRLRTLLWLVLVIPAVTFAQQQSRVVVNVVYSPARPEKPDDPGYELYKRGYSAILDENWPDAKKTFGGLLAKYPKSAYAEDAAYWSAYATSRIDRREGIAAYRKFLKDRPKSSYFNDAVADLDELQPPVAPGPPPSVGMIPDFPAPSAFVPNMGNLQRQLRRQFRQMERMGESGNFSGIFVQSGDPEHLDQATRLKMEALYALGEMKEDDESFQTLKQVAIDQRQQRPLREAAIEALAQFRKHDPVPVYVTIVKTDTALDMQNLAIDFIGETGRDKKATVKVLGDLYGHLPASRKDVQRTIVYTIADVGNDAAVDFLGTVVLSKGNDEVRSDAIYYLGTIGGPKARTILYNILKGHP